MEFATSDADGVGRGGGKIPPEGGILFAIPDICDVSSAASILDHLGEPACDAPWERLSEMIEARARELPIPDGCLVIAPDPQHPQIWADLLAALVVLAKSSEHVWLRTKTPSFANMQRRRHLSLFVPFTLRSRLPKEEK